MLVSATSECVITSQRTGLGASSASESRPAQVQTRGLYQPKCALRSESLFRLDNEYPAIMTRVKNEELVKWKAQPHRSALSAHAARPSPRNARANQQSE